MHTTPLHMIQSFCTRHRFILMALPIICVVTATLLLMVIPARYTATGLIEIMPRGSDLSPLATIQAPLPTDSMVLTQVSIITSAAVLKRAGQRLDQPLNTLQRVVGAAPVSRSYIMRVTADAADPKMAQHIANTVMEEYMLYKTALRSQRLQGTADWLREHLVGLSEHLQRSAEAFTRYQTTEKLVDTRDVPVTDQQLSDLSSLIIDARTQQAEIHATDHVSSQNKRSKALTEQLKSPVLSAIAQDEAVLAMKLAELQHKYGAKHPDRLSAQAEMAGLQAKKQQEIARLNAAIHEERTITDQKISNLEQQFEQLKDQRHHERKTGITLQTLKNEAAADRALYDSLLKQSKELALYADLDPSDSQIVAWAEKPLHKANPHALLVILLSACAGLLLALVTSLITDQLTLPYQREHREHII